MRSSCIRICCCGQNIGDGRGTQKSRRQMNADIIEEGGPSRRSSSSSGNTLTALAHLAGIGRAGNAELQNAAMGVDPCTYTNKNLVRPSSNFTRKISVLLGVFSLNFDFF